MPKETAITKKRLWILAGLLAFALFWNELLAWLAHALVLVLEWLELTVDTIFEELLQFTPEVSQMATAWTGFLTLIALLVFGGYRLRRRYLRFRAKGKAWQQTKSEEFWHWWASLRWYEKLGYAASLCFFLALMMLTN